MSSRTFKKSPNLITLNLTLTDVKPGSKMFLPKKSRRRQFSGSSMMTSPFGGGGSNNNSSQIFVPESPLPSPKFNRHSNQRTLGSPSHVSPNCDPADAGSGHSSRAANSPMHYAPPSPAHPRSSICSQGTFKCCFKLGFPGAESERVDH